MVLSHCAVVMTEAKGESRDLTISNTVPLLFESFCLFSKKKMKREIKKENSGGREGGGGGVGGGREGC